LSRNDGCAKNEEEEEEEEEDLQEEQAAPVSASQPDTNWQRDFIQRHDRDLHRRLVAPADNSAPITMFDQK
jgi:hypothetical protein